MRLPIATCLLLLAAFAAHAATAANEIAIDAARIRQSLQANFPYSVDALGGLVVVTARDPQLDIPVQGNRLKMQFHAGIASAGDSVPLGRVHLSGGLRYDRRTRGFHLDAPVIERIVPDQPGLEIDASGREMLSLLLQDYAQTQPLYQLDPKWLANFGNLQVESARIEGGQVIVAFDQPVALELPDEE